MLLPPPDHLSLRIDDVPVRLALLDRPGDGPPVVALHGFGSTKEDWSDLAPALAGRPLLAWDAPGCGASTVADPTAVSVPFLVRTAEAVLDQSGVDRFHLVGHSMGGLTALLLAVRRPHQVLSFTDVEGNLAPEDCFLSRQVLTHPDDEPRSFLDALAERARRSPEPGSALFAAGLRAKVDAAVVAPILSSMVELSDHEPLLQHFLDLPFPRVLVHGETNAGLGYLPRLRAAAAAGVTVASVARSGHWPMYTNAPALWDLVAAVVQEAER